MVLTLVVCPTDAESIDFSFDSEFWPSRISDSPRSSHRFSLHGIFYERADHTPPLVFSGLRSARWFVDVTRFSY